MELDSKNLGRLTRVADPREVWPSEASDFTPWLAQNIDVLADALDMTLTLVDTEVNVGQFKLDIQAQDDNGRVVIIENQLEKTDHSHLGQCLVYAASLEASTVIWISRQFRDDFRRAFDWLNERTDRGIQFFGVEVGVVQIGEAGRGPLSSRSCPGRTTGQRELKQLQTGIPWHLPSRRSTTHVKTYSVTSSTA